MSPSAAARASTASFTPPSRTQRPVFAQAPQAVQPETGPVPTLMSSVSTPSAASVRAISSSAARVLPLSRGLPFMSSTFIMFPP